VKLRLLSVFEAAPVAFLLPGKRSSFAQQRLRALVIDGDEV
jgi:hypothetical protein